MNASLPTCQGEECRKHRRTYHARLVAARIDRKVRGAALGEASGGGVELLLSELRVGEVVRQEGETARPRVTDGPSAYMHRELDMRVDRGTSRSLEKKCRETDTYRQNAHEQRASHRPESARGTDR